MRWLVQIGLVALGSACGGVARWGVAAAVGRCCGTTFPFGTFLVNITGSFFLGWFLTVLAERLGDGTWLRPDDLRLMVAVGFTGSFTTFSTFEYESHGLLRDGDGLAAMTYIFLSVLLGLLAVRLGILTARLV
ncbi:MAG: CrcB family protein [Thermodesulfobacteriota bacterium]